MTHVRPELRVEIQRLGNRYQAVLRTGNGHELATHEFQHGTASLVRGSTAWLSTSEDMSPAVEPIPDAVQIAAQGWQLYRNLFDNGRRLRDYLTSLRGAEEAQLTLSLGSGTELLTRVPWEYLYDGDRYLCLSGNLPVSRLPRNLHRLELPPTPLPLRILLVMAAPEDQPSFEVGRELALLQRALTEDIRTGAVCLDVLAEPTSTILREATQTYLYHVIHYIGYGIHQLPQREGFLCLEDSWGRTELVSGTQLAAFLGRSLPYLVLLSGAPRAEFGVVDAFAGVAHDLLHNGIPAALSIAGVLSDSSACAFYKTFYNSLVNSENVGEALYRGRAAIKRVEDEAAPAKHQFDWAIPILYQRNPDLQLIQVGDPESWSSQQDPSPSLPQRAHSAVSLVGRTPQLHAVRRALQESARVFYVSGSDGIGKRSFIRHLQNHLPHRPSATLTIHCASLIEPLSVLGQIANFWRSSGSDAEEEAAHLLLDARQDPFRRAQQAQRLLETKRLLLSFENIDRWFTSEGQRTHTIANDIVRHILLGLITTPSKSLFVFTGARRWDELADREDANIREIHLPLLSTDWAIQVMNGLPELRTATLPQKHAIHWHIGGHPKCLELLAGWLRTGQDLASLLASPPVGERSTELWEAFLIDEILRQLDPGEFQILQALALVPYPASTATLSELTPVTSEYAQPLIEQWRRLGIMETFDSGEDDEEIQYNLYLAVRDTVLDRMAPGEIAELHLEAAAHCGAPFVDGARRQVLSRNITAWTHDRIEWLARDTNGILGTRLRQQSDQAHLQLLLARAMAWQQHLSGAGRVEEATQIVQAMAPALKQLQETDLAEALMRRTVKLTSQSGYTTGADQLAQLRLEEGPLAAALDVYRQVYNSLDPEQAQLQRAHVMIRAGMVQQRLGNTQDAIASFEVALQVIRREGDKESEAECLYRLAMLQRESGAIQQALVYSQAAKEHYEAFDSPSGLAAVEREQGVILKELGHFENALDCLAASLRISRRLGDTRGVTETLTEIGLILEKCGRNEMAIRVIEEALQHYEYLRSPEHSEILALLEELYARKQRLDEAVAKLRTARTASHRES
jgi:tetratricopeptide (TPR) repeat protein